MLRHSSVEAGIVQLPLNTNNIWLALSFNLALNCISDIISLHNSLLRDYFSPIFLLEFDLTETNNAASSA